MAEQRTVFITGASKGIGRATADILARQGHQIIGASRKNPGDNFPGEFLECDMSDRAATADLVKDVAARHRVDAVVNNVGLVNPQKLGEIDLDSLDAVIQVNMGAAIQSTQAFLPHMKQTGWGRVVNISSLVVVGVPYRTAYAAAKAGLVSFTKSWALELAADGITVNAVAPGPTETELFLTNNPPGSESHTRYVGMVPMKRVGRPEEIAAAVVFFLSEEASFITGQTLFACGGSSVGHLPG